MKLNTHLRFVALNLILFSSLFVSVVIGQSVKIKHLSTAPVVDGQYDAIWDSVKYQSIETVNTGTISSGDDFSGRFKVGWASDALFFYVFVRDNEWRNDANANQRADDGVEIYLDVNNDKSGSYGSNDFNFLMRYEDASVYEMQHGITTGVTSAQYQSGDTVCFEIAIPFSLISLTDVVHKLPMGFDIHMNDNDGGTRQGRLSWFSEYTTAINNPSYLGTAFFSVVTDALRASKPEFSAKRGIYHQAFDLTLSSEHSGATIWYTLDGSNPLFSDTRLEAVAPVIIHLDPSSSTNRGGQTPGVIVRAAAEATGFSISKVATHTYIFIDALNTQSDPQGIWPDQFAMWSWPGYNDPQAISYDMNTVMTQSATYGDIMDDAFLEIPSYSLVTENGNLFDATSGIYMNALKEGWERPVSIELIDPNGSDFQADAAIRMRGRYSRLPRNAKHSFRILFKDDYGSGKLNYSVFGDKGLDKYDHLDFRTAQNSSWQSEESHSTLTFIKEIFARDVQRKMDWDHTLSQYCHLYINGMYWGLYQIQERADSKFAEAYMGYDERDYDVVKPQKDVIDPPNDLLIGVSDGNLDAAERLWDAMIAGFSSDTDYFRVQGMNADGTPNAAYERLLDVENLIDYLLVAFYTGSEDGPGVIWPGLWGNMVRPNNFIGIYNRTNPDGFKWIVHDMEKSMYHVAADTYTHGLDDSWYSEDFTAFNPLTIHRSLLDNAEYRITFMDRVYKYFENEGLLTPDNVHQMLSDRKAEIYNPVVAEAARWSWWVTINPYYYTLETAPTRTDWESNVDYLLNSYVPGRTSEVLSQFAAWGYNPVLDPPSLLEAGIPITKKSVSVDEGANLLFSHPNSQGTIYYGNGIDPRAVGGGIHTSAQAISSNAPITVNHGMMIQARVKNGTDWSPLYEVNLNVEKEVPGLTITEIHYNPSVDSTGRSGDLEFIELKNTGESAIDLSGYTFTKGIEFTFPATRLQAGEFFVLASDLDTFQIRYGFTPDALYLGNLKNSGESLELRDTEGSIVMKLDYSDGGNWPMLADGYGYSLVPADQDFTSDPDKSEYWRSSTNKHGSPGADDPAGSIAPIVINEVLSNTYPDVFSSVELYNPTTSEVNIGGWYLSDNRQEPLKWQIPDATTIAAGGYFELDSDDWGTTFKVDSDGEELCLTSATTAGALTGYATKVKFGASFSWASFGTYTNSQGQDFFVTLEETSFNAVNGLPAVGPVVISEIMYHPLINTAEYIKLKNISSDAVSFSHATHPQYTWKVGGADFQFPENVTLNPGASLYIYEADMADTTFRRIYQIGSGVQVFAMEGSLSNGGETISLYRPGIIDNNNKIERPPYVLVESVTYSDKAPWYPITDGHGYALMRVNQAEFANDPSNWAQKLITSLPDLDELVVPDEISIYPNPTGGQLQLELPSVDVANIVVRDIYGRMVFQSIEEGSYISLDISVLKAGIYFLSVEQEGVSTVKRIVKE